MMRVLIIKFLEWKLKHHIIISLIFNNIYKQSHLDHAQVPGVKNEALARTENSVKKISLRGNKRSPHVSYNKI